jgi:hypothetical protein
MQAMHAAVRSLSQTKLEDFAKNFPGILFIINRLLICEARKSIPCFSLCLFSHCVDRFLSSQVPEDF